MFNYLHGDITKQVSVTNAGVGARFDAFAVRTQIAFQAK
jgi:phosphate-selective porin OprO and OprP